ncbi:hypothetical protein [Plesiomonas shigelloides]|nr:hypothetical protein [Plesiomonas shigelloides]
MNIQGVYIPPYIIAFALGVILIPAAILGEFLAIKIAKWMNISA